MFSKMQESTGISDGADPARTPCSALFFCRSKDGLPGWDERSFCRKSSSSCSCHHVGVRCVCGGGGRGEGPLREGIIIISDMIKDIIMISL